MAETVIRKAMMSHVTHTPTGFLVFNKGKDTKGIPTDMLKRLADEGIIARGKDEPAPEPPASEARQPQVGDQVTSDEAGGGWFTISAPWLDEPLKVRGEDAATAKVAELSKLVPAAAE